jgi:hypothetical protein
MNRFHTTLCVLGLLWACGGSSSSPKDSIASGDKGTRPDIVQTGEPMSRHVRRVSVEQLQRSIPIVTGGLIWEEDFGDGTMDMLELLKPTLGAPDYLIVTEEILEPSLIVAKFMLDAAQRICPRWIMGDKEASMEERTLVFSADWHSLDPEDIQTNLRRLQLRFYGRHVPSTDESANEALFQLFNDATKGASGETAAERGWLAVCIAMFTSPDFILY